MAVPEVAAAARVSVASYNVHACVGHDRCFDPQRVVRVLQELDADIVALQEVTSRYDPGRELLDYAVRLKGYKVLEGPTVLRPNGHFGNALLTRLPVLTSRLLDISHIKREPRGAIDVDLELNNGAVRVVATHLGLSPRERRFQIRRLLDLIGSEDRCPVILLGDINEWFIWGRPLRWLHSHFGKPPAPRSFPAHFPIFALDRIWISRPGKLLQLSAHSSELARAASDHLPVKAIAQW